MAPREIELKLHLPDGVADALARHALLKAVQAQTLRLDAIYFDTADRLLRRNAMALRLRRGGRRWTQTLKTAGDTRGGLSTRAEWEAPATVARGRPQIDLSLLGDTPLPALLAEHPAKDGLLPIFRTRYTRVLRTVHFGQSEIEVAIDQGRIEAKRARSPLTEPISEIELELKAGRAEDLLAFALRLIGRGRRAPALVPLPNGKAERGYRLASDEPVAPTKAAARGFVAALKPNLSAGAALRAIMAHGLDVLAANTEALRTGHDPEYVHQARVSLRRMRSALRLLDRSHADFPQSLADELRWAGRLLGAARDWDVLTAHTLPGLVAAAGDGIASQWGRLTDRAQQQRDTARNATVTALAGARYAQLALRLQAWAMTTAPKGASLARLAAPRLRKARRRLLRSASFFAALSPEGRHRVRILAKRLRYALDVFSVALPKSPAERYTSALSDLQDVLGELNDFAVARASLASLSDHDTLDPELNTSMERRERELLVEAEARLLALAESKVPWD